MYNGLSQVYCMNPDNRVWSEKPVSAFGENVINILKNIE